MGGVWLVLPDSINVGIARKYFVLKKLSRTHASRTWCAKKCHNKSTKTFSFEYFIWWNFRRLHQYLCSKKLYRVSHIRLKIILKEHSRVFTKYYSQYRLWWYECWSFRSKAAILKKDYYSVSIPTNIRTLFLSGLSFMYKTNMYLLQKLK